MSSLSGAKGVWSAMTAAGAFDLIPQVLQEIGQNSLGQPPNYSIIELKRLHLPRLFGNFQLNGVMPLRLQEIIECYPGSGRHLPIQNESRPSGQ